MNGRPASLEPPKPPPAAEAGDAPLTGADNGDLSVRGQIRRWTRRVFRTLGVLVVVAMAAFLACQHVLPPFLHSGEAAAAATIVPPAEDPRKIVVCFGFADLEGGIVALHPSQPGRVEEVLVRENDTVPAGAPLLRLDDRAARLRVEEAKAVLDEATARLAKAEKAPEEHRLKVKNQQAAVEMARFRLAAAQHTLTGRQEQLKGEAIGRYRDDPTTVELVASTAQRVKEFEEVARSEQYKLATLELQDPATDLQLARAETATMRARWRQAEELLGELTLRAPVAGRVLRILVAPGELISVPPKRMAVQFCPDRPRIVRAEVDQAFARRVEVGQPAVVEDDASSDVVWRGHVMRLSDWYTQRREVAEEHIQLKDVRTLECLIVLDPGQPPLRVGQRVRVTICRKEH
ncbi:MAG TPA: HlyD family efflux transporter periplasmic adaptor subunit [Gemmataceae bacterium]|jgi:multidrug resistance efflux pump